MLETAGLDPTVSATLSNVLQEGVLPGGEAADAIQIGSDPANIAVVVGGNGGASSGGVAAAPGGEGSAAVQAGTLAADSAAGGIPPSCGADELSRRLQAGGQFWNAQDPSVEPVSFAKGLFAGRELWKSLGGSRPGGNPTNIPATGPAGTVVQVQRRLRSAVPLKIPCSGSGAHSFSPESWCSTLAEAFACPPSL